jgi:DnaJ-class molecular chaperone
VAGENGQTGENVESAHGPRECMPCRGTGSVISNLGGTQRTLECPWCRGSGARLAGVDAQAHWREEGTGGEAGANDAPEPAA